MLLIMKFISFKRKKDIIGSAIDISLYLPTFIIYRNIG